MAHHKRRRRRRGLGDLLSDRVDRAIISRRAKGLHASERKEKVKAMRALCAEGHDQYCTSFSKRRAARASATRCKAPKGKVCVTRAAAVKSNGRLRKGCTHRVKDDAYVCSTKALTPHAGRTVRRRKKKATKHKRKTTHARKTTHRRKATTHKRKRTTAKHGGRMVFASRARAMHGGKLKSGCRKLKGGRFMCPKRGGAKRHRKSK